MNMIFFTGTMQECQLHLHMEILHQDLPERHDQATQARSKQDALVRVI